MVPPGSPYEDVLASWLEASERGDQQTAEALLVQHPGHAEALRRAAARLERNGLLGTPPAEARYPECLGEFRLLQRLGSGGMGLVFLAEQTSLRRKVAVKLVRPELLLSPIARERFQREVATVAQLQHPGIVPVLAVGEHSGVPYFAMEYVAGCSLDEVLLSVADRPVASLDGQAFARAIGASDPPAPHPRRTSWWQAVTATIASVAETTAYVHARGILHRDLKPSNVMVTPQGHTMLLDFGLAQAPDQAPLTRSGAQLGSLPYMSPEQLRGEAVDERTDVYSLGVTLYQMLALRRAFDGANEGELRQAIGSGRSLPLRQVARHLPRDLTVVVATAIDIDRGRRYPSMAAFAADLRAVLAGTSVTARPATLRTRTTRWMQRHPFVAGALLAVLLVVLALPAPIAARELERSATLDRARQRAEDDLAQARHAIETMREQANQLLSLRSQPATALWRRMIEQVSALYADLAIRHPDDAELCRAQATTACLLANERRSAGDLAGARAHLDIAREAHRRHPDQESVDGMLIEAMVAGMAATLAFEAFDTATAERHAERRQTILMELASRAPTATAVQWDLADAENDLANIRGCQGRRAEKIALLRSALSRRQRHLGTAPLPQARIALAQLANNLAEMILIDPGSEPEAERLFRGALDEVGDLPSPWNDHPDTRALLGEIHCGLGSLAGMNHEAPRAEQEFDTARRLVEDLAAADPSSLSFSYLRVRIEVERAKCRLQHDDRAGARRAADLGVQIASAALSRGESPALAALRDAAARLSLDAQGR